MTATRACLLFVPAIIAANAQSLSSELEGKRLVGKNSEFAGFEFKSKNTIVFYAEETGNTPIAEARVRWLSEDTFLAVEKGPETPGCSPKTWIYRAIKRSKETIIFHQFWTGWAPSEDPIPTFRVVAPAKPEGATAAP